jgi:hypothetical protein
MISISDMIAKNKGINKWFESIAHEVAINTIKIVFNSTII